ncbi:MAG: AAA family ATPase, partial [Gemmataceae bacterium]
PAAETLNSVGTMRDVLRIAIVDPSDVTREELRNVLLGLEQIWLEAECSRYEFFYDVISQSMPDVVMISLDSDQAKALALIQGLHAEAPEIPILAISARGDGQAILQALRSGAREFITAPVVMEELLKALQRLHRTNPGVSARPGDNGSSRVESQVIAVIGSRGGVGCTTVGVNLGATLAQDPGFGVALVDLDLALGDADVLLDLVADYTLADVALNVDRLDMQFLKRSLCKHSSGMSLLPHPVQMEDAGLIREDHLTRVIGLLRASYTHLILDLSKSFSATDVTALGMADVILLVCQLELSSLRNVVRMLMTLGNDEAIGQKVKIVVNRVGSDNDISISKAEETIGKPIYWQIPNDARVINEARNDGKPLIQAAPKSKAQQSIFAMAESLAGKPLRAAVKEASRGWSLFSR